MEEEYIDNNNNTLTILDVVEEVLSLYVEETFLSDSQRFTNHIDIYKWTEASRLFPQYSKQIIDLCVNLYKIYELKNIFPKSAISNLEYYFIDVGDLLTSSFLTDILFGRLIEPPTISLDNQEKIKFEVEKILRELEIDGENNIKIRKNLTIYKVIEYVLERKLSLSRS